jgi:D-alanyl-D-alanine carboxypeptidase/D-alanyl-D-alanine-endopeptidase (penicillin-binding protein 4)
VPDEPRDSSPQRGPAVVVASSHRLRRRVIGGIVVLVLLVAGGITALVVTHRDSGPTATTAAPVPDAQLPTVADPPPVLAALSAQAPQPTPQALARTLAPLLSASALGSGVGAQVVDVATGTVLLDQAGATPGTPASTAKLLTSAAVLTTLDPESTLTTKVVAGSAPGEVVLVGGGDPTLTRADTSPSYPGAASIKDLAAQVKAALPGTAITRVVVDGSLFSGPLTASGWQPGDAPSTYASPITAAMVDGGRTSATAVNRSGSPSADAGQALATALGVPRATVAAGTAPAGARTLGTVHSAPVSRIVEQALSQSDNVLAEALARQVAIARHLPPTFEGAAQGIVAALRQDGIDISGVTMVDGSGLSRTDSVPPAVLAAVLTRTASGGLPRAAAILSGLAVAGYDGTLADRGDSDPSTAPGAVRAKTGTLLGVHGLAGTVVTHDGRLLVFALLADHSTGGDAPAEGALDDVAAALAGCGCR